MMHNNSLILILSLSVAYLGILLSFFAPLFSAFKFNTLASISGFSSGTDAYFEQQFISPTIESHFFNSNDWIVGVILVSLTIFATTRLFYGKVFTSTLRALFDSRVSNKLHNENNNFTQRVSASLLAIFIINGGLFLYEILSHYGINLINLPGFVFFIALCFFLFVLLGIKKYTLKFLGFILKKEALFAEYLHNIFLYNKAIGICLLPVVIGVPFMSDWFSVVLINLAIISIILCIVLRYNRGVGIIINKQVSVFYMILYLCAVEIFPVLIAYKFINSLI